jgi:hypothetical protein
MPAPASFFGYTTGLVTLVVSASEVPFSLPIENEYDFVWTDAIHSSDQATVMAGTDIVFGGVLVNFSDQARQNRIFKNPVPITHVFGTPGVGRGWFRLPYLMRFPGNGAISLFFTNLTAGTVNLRMSLLGFQIPPGQPLPI